MLRKFLTALFVLSGSQVAAQNCPDFFRFVDFGLQDQGGAFHRGGTVFRAESLGGTPLLHRELTKCRAVNDTSIDGHGHPMPVVTSISYDVARTGLDLTELRVSFHDDIEATISENLYAHRSALRQPEAERIKGENSICALSKERDALSCQLISPYPGDLDLVVFCTLDGCEMPALGVDQHIGIVAAWAVPDALWSDPERAGSLLYDKVQSIYGFLEPLT